MDPNMDMNMPVNVPVDDPNADTEWYLEITHRPHHPHTDRSPLGTTSSANTA